jgi:hypothetical protein
MWYLDGKWLESQFFCKTRWKTRQNDPRDTLDNASKVVETHPGKCPNSPGDALGIRGLFSSRPWYSFDISQRIS